ncbi:MAG: YhjD/YihY/BrkB family envelope integrity protein [Holophaga sp.]|nr:YhjD/YihY/BrkB family envelope integrity protein [Holophaga sp.]
MRLIAPNELRDRLLDAMRSARVVLIEAFHGFRRNDDLRQASSLAFATMLALIPALLLLAAILGASIGSSRVAMQRVTEFVGDVIPKFGDVILREVSTLASHKKSAGALNFLILFWAITPLVTSTRSIINQIFRVTPKRAFWISKAFDFQTAMAFITGIAAVAGMGIALRFLKTLPIDLIPPVGLKFMLPFALTTGLVLLMYAVYSPRTKTLHLLAGAIATTTLWFLLRPAFSLFLTYNSGFGVTFGSFKSIFIIVIWIYYSQAVFLFGAEVVAALHRHETVLIKRWMEGKGGTPRFGHTRLMQRIPAGGVLFHDGDVGREMFHILKGRVSIQKAEAELAVLGPGAFFGEMSFLLGQPRSATAIALDECDCLVIHEENIDTLMREFPAIPRDMLTEMARRLRATSAHHESLG